MLTPSQSNIQTSLRTFLLSILPTGVEVIEGQDNRVPEPHGADFVVMTPTKRRRIETNIDNYGDTAFTASIAGNLMTVIDVGIGQINPDTLLFGTGVVTGTVITGYGSGIGGTGTYFVNPPQNLPLQQLASGTATYMQPTEVVVQCDVHGPNSADNAEIITTLFRDDYAVQAFLSYGYDVSPLYADDPKQVPFINAERQYENRWIVEARLQANQVVTLPQQFAASLRVNLIEVESTYPE